MTGKIDSLPNEKWRDVVGYEGLYRVSNLGRLKALPKYEAMNRLRNYEKLIATSIHAKTKYVTVCLCKNSNQRTVRLHRIVLEAFVTRPGIKYQVNHVNANKVDNRLKNLEWMTQAQNNQHARNLGLIPVSANRKFSAKQVLDIRKRIADGCSPIVLAKSLDVSYSTIHRISRKHFYKEI